MVLEKIKKNLGNLKKEYNNQPEIKIVRFIKVSPDPTPLKETVYILAKDEKLRKFNPVGGSTTLTINPDWLQHFKGRMRGHLIQTETRKGICFFEETGGETNE